MLALGLFISFITFAYNRKRMEHQKEVEGLSEAYQKEIFKAQVEVQEQTFLAISQEIHDNVGQVLSLVRLHVSTLDCGGNASSLQKVESSKELLDQAIEDLRDLSKRLNSNYVVQQSLSSLLQFQLGLLQKTGALEASFRLVGEEQALEPEKKLLLLRIAQEALQNIIRHAEASFIWVELSFAPDKMVLQIRDDGKGFPTAGQVSPQGTGTHNMYYRAALIGARLSIQSSPAGTQVLIEIP